METNNQILRILQEIKEQGDNQMADLSKLITDITKLIADIATMISNQANQQAQVTALQGQITTLTTQNAALQAQIASDPAGQPAVDNLDAQVAAADASLVAAFPAAASKPAPVANHAPPPPIVI